MSSLPYLPSLEGDILLDVYTHNSLNHEETVFNEHYGDNTRFQELGESALTLAVTNRLFLVKPMLPTPDIVAKKQEVLSDENIDTWVKGYDMKKNLKFSPAVRNEINTPQESRALLFAYLGAVYYSKGLGPIVAWVDRIVEPSAESAGSPRPSYPVPPSSSPPALPPSASDSSRPILAAFNQKAHQAKRSIEWAPKQEGPPHSLVWTVSCSMDNPIEGQTEKILVGTGQGSNLKNAKEAAAKVANEMLRWGL